MLLFPARDDLQEMMEEKRAASFRNKARNKLSGTKTCRNTDMHPFMNGVKESRFAVQIYKNVFEEPNQQKAPLSSLYEMKY